MKMVSMDKAVYGQSNNGNTLCSLASDEEEEETREVETRSYELEFDMKKFTYS